MYKEKEFNKIIKEICEEKNIDFTELSDDWVIKLKKENKTKFIVGYRFDLNTQAISDICNDKYALYTVLKSEDIPIIEYAIIFKNEEDKLSKYFKLYNQDVVLKPNNGTCGNNVVHITDYDTLIKKYNEMMLKIHSVTICPFYDIENEFRVIYLPKLQYVYKKVKPVVVGDGVHSIKELLEQFNFSYFSNEDNLKNDNFNVEKIPDVGEIIEYEWRFNLSKGAVIAKVSDEEKSEILYFIKDITTIIDLNFVSIDIVKLKSGEYKVMEINSGVMMENLVKLEKDGYEIAKRIYEQAIDNMFS